MLELWAWHEECPIFFKCISIARVALLEKCTSYVPNQTAYACNFNSNGTGWKVFNATNRRATRFWSSFLVAFLTISQYIIMNRILLLLWCDQRERENFFYPSFQTHWSFSFCSCLTHTRRYTTYKGISIKRTAFAAHKRRIFNRSQ